MIGVSAIGLSRKGILAELATLRAELPSPSTLCNKTVERESESRFIVGVIVDETLTWAKQIQPVRNIPSRCIGILYKLKARIQIYHSFV